MARVTAERVEETKAELLEAAREVLVKEGYAGLSTRRVADAAGTQMSQIQYHFGSKEGMILALFEYMNRGLIERQNSTFNDSDLTISQKWLLACDYLDEDFASGYVRVLQELIAAGWTNPGIGAAIRSALGKWHHLLTSLANDAEKEFGSLGPLSSGDFAALAAATFVGAESLVLLGYEDEIHSMRQALRRFGELLAGLEKQQQQE